MLVFINFMISMLVQFVASIEQLLSFVVNLPVILWSLFVSFPLFMQVGFAVLISFFITFLSFKIYDLIK